MRLRVGRFILVCFASLALLPGCRHSASFAVSEPNRQVQAYTDAPVEQLREAGAQPPALLKNEAKPADLPQLEIMGRAFQQSPLHEKPAPTGRTGVVTIGDLKVEPDPGASALKMQPLPQVLEPRQAQAESAAVVKALQCMLDGRHQEAIQHLRAYDDSTQEFLLRLLPPMTMFVKKRIADMSQQEVAVLNDQLHGLLTSIRSRSELLIGKMAYCKRIRTFGDYDLQPDNHAFLTATDSRPGELVQLYVELKNFSSEQAKDGEYLTRLACVLELYNAKGEKVWSHRFDKGETTYARRTRLNDFHSNFSFCVPAIPAGRYQLTVEIADETIPSLRRVARKSLDFPVTPAR